MLKKIVTIGRITFDDRLRDTHVRPSGFDYLRTVLALLVIAFHAVVTSCGDDAQNQVLASIWRGPIASLVAMFFSISGFLVAGSLSRSKTLIGFMGLRALRIVPALTGEVFLSALVLGPLLTTLPLSSYFHNPQFRTYFLNIIGDTHYLLPGVFTHNPLPLTVNGQLWTVPWEMACYTGLAAAAFIGLLRRKNYVLYVMIALHIGAVILSCIIARPAVGNVSVISLGLMFWAGALFFQYRDRVIWDFRLFLLSVVALAVLLNLTNGDFFAALPMAYAAVYLGLTNPPRNKIILSGDYSYGLYLYGYPLQQAFAAIGPAVQTWYWNLLGVVPCAFLIAAISWWTIEKPALSLKTQIKKFEKSRFAARLPTIFLTHDDY